MKVYKLFPASIGFRTKFPGFSWSLPYEDYRRYLNENLSLQVKERTARLMLLFVLAGCLVSGIFWAYANTNKWSMAFLVALLFLVLWHKLANLVYFSLLYRWADEPTRRQAKAVRQKETEIYTKTKWVFYPVVFILVVFVVVVFMSVL